MPVITIEYDREKVSQEQVEQLTVGVHDAVVAVTGIQDVPVYANSAEVSYKISPIEIWIEVSAHKIPNDDVKAWLDEISAKLKAWREEAGFDHPLNVTLNPSPWKFNIGV